MSAPHQDPPGAPPDDIEDADPGLARERTELAWTRTAISFAAIGAAIGKYRPAVGAPILVFSAIIWPIGYFSRTQVTARTAGRRVLAVTVAVTSLAVIGLVLTLLSHPSRGFRPLSGVAVPRSAGLPPSEPCRAAASGMLERPFSKPGDWPSTLWQRAHDR